MSLLNTNLISEYQVSQQLEANIIYWLNYELLGTCAFFNINLPTSGSYGGSFSQMRRSNDPNFSSGRVWEGARKQWVWQSGVGCSTQPIQISGVYVNNIFRPATGVDGYAYKVDYPNGRIIFNSGISTSATVKVAHSFNYYQIYNSDSPWWKEVQRNSFRVDDASFLITSSGFWSRPPEIRLQLPAIIVNMSPKVEKEPRQLGNFACIHKQDVNFFIIAETNKDRQWIMDAIGNQLETTHDAFDSNLMMASGMYPLNSDGSINTIGVNYPELINRFNWNRTWHFEKFVGWEPDGLTTKSSNPLFTAVLTGTISTYL
jgi:hypothetical protein